MSRITRWGILLGCLVVLLVAYALLVPYRTWEFTLDRRTGRMSVTVTWCCLIRTDESTQHNFILHDPMFPSRMTAEVQHFPVGRYHQRHPWADPGAFQPRFPGAWYAEGFAQMFGIYRLPGGSMKSLSPAELDAVFDQRIPRWNSREFTRDPLAFAEAARRENEVLLGAAQEWFYLRQ